MLFGLPDLCPGQPTSQRLQDWVTLMPKSTWHKPVTYIPTPTTALREVKQ